MRMNVLNLHLSSSPPDAVKDFTGRLSRRKMGGSSIIIDRSHFCSKN